MSQFYNPYRDKYGKTVKRYNLYQGAPSILTNDDQVLSNNLKLGEIRKSSYVLDDEKNLFSYVYLDTRLIEAFQLLRDALGKPITVTSSFRSQRYEWLRKRSGDSTHTYGMALDLTGTGLVELLKEALKTKNKLYQRLRAAGVNGFGIYEDKNFIHIDTRQAKSDGGYALWFGSEDKELKKKESSMFTNPTKILGIGVGVVLLVIGFYKKLKDWRR